MLLEKAASGFIFQECKSFPFCGFRELIFHSIKTRWGNFSVIHLSFKRLVTFGFFFLITVHKFRPSFVKGTRRFFFGFPYPESRILRLL